jgi:hypothetical protein
MVFVGFVFGASDAAAGGEEATCLDDSVAGSYGAGGRDRVVSGFDAHHSVFQLGDNHFDKELGRSVKLYDDEVGL